MKKSPLLFFIISLFFLSNCKDASKTNIYETEKHQDANGFTYETVTNDPTGLRLYTLENGLKVYLSQNQDEPKIQTYIAVRAGSNYDPKDRTGLAHYLEHMLFKGTDKIGTSDWAMESQYIDSISQFYERHKEANDPVKKKSIYREIDRLSSTASNYAIANEIDKMMSSIGAQGTNAHTWYEETVYHNKIPANELNKFLLLEKERFSKLVLRLFHTELEAVYEEFNRSQDNDGRKTYFAMMDALFPTHPYGQQTTIGTSEHLKNPSMLSIHEYFETYYVPNNMALVLVGDLEFDKTIKMVDATLGQFKSKELNHPELPKERPMSQIVEKEVFGPSAENISLAYRCEGKGSEEEKFITLIDMILSNSSAGLFDLNLNQKQLLQNASSSPSFNIDYGVLRFTGYPKSGQSLDEVKNLMLEQVELIKQGDFDDWMIEAIVNDLKLTKTKQYENATSVAGLYYGSFIQRQDWKDRLAFLKELKNISKEEVVAFANEFFNENYAVVYKRQGKDENIVKVENPEITPIKIDNESRSEFLIDFSQMEPEALTPVFVDYKKLILKNQLKSGIEMSYIKNTNNDLFSLNVIFDMGKDNDKKLPLAVGYLEYLGTEKYAANDLKKEFYKLGIDYSVNTGYDRSYISISGLQENLGRGLELLEHLLAGAVVDQEAYDNYVSRILKSRENSRGSKDNILWGGLVNYALYGENSRLRNIYDADELNSMDPADLVKIIKDLNNFKHRIFYYGKNEKEAIKALDLYHITDKALKDYPVAEVFEEQETGGKVFYANFDMVQAELVFLGKGKVFNPKKMAVSSVFNAYFGGNMSSVIFQELRESKSLAYAAFASYQQASKTDRSDIAYAYIGTQANKLTEAVEAMDQLLKEMPVVEQKFQDAKEAALKQIEAQRITKSNIFWNYERLKKRGIDYDIRSEIYDEIKGLTMQDLVDFFNENIKSQEYSLSVIGNKDVIDFKSLQKFGEFQELEVDYLFNYKDIPVKQ